MLIKAVAQAIPTYTMSVFKVPVSLCSEMNSLTSNYWWSGSKSSRGIHWLKWSKLCTPKKQGGLGFRNILLFNQALLAKQAWKLVHNTTSLAYQVLKGKYFPTSDFLRAKEEMLYMKVYNMGKRDVTTWSTKKNWKWVGYQNLLSSMAA